MINDLYKYGGHIQDEWGDNGTQAEPREPVHTEDKEGPRSYGEVVHEYGIVGHMAPRAIDIPGLPPGDPPPAALYSNNLTGGPAWISVDSNGNLYVYGNLIASGGGGTPDWFNVKTYGATGNGTTDDTAAIQAAIHAANALSQTLSIDGNGNVIDLTSTVFIPFGNYLITSPLTLNSGVAALRITGDAGSRLFSNSSGIIDFQNHDRHLLEIDHLTLDATGGHIFTNAQLSYSWFHHLQLMQRSAGYSIWDQTQASNQLQNSAFTDIRCTILPDPTTGLRSVPAWNIQCPSGASFAEVQFYRFNTFNAGNTNGGCDNSQYFFDLACTATGTSAYMTQITFRDISLHRPYGGAIRAKSAAGLLIDHLTQQDIYTNTNGGSTPTNILANSCISVGTTSGGSASRAVWVRNYHRGNTAATGGTVDPSDITVTSDTINVRVDGFIMTTTPSLDAPQINLNGAAGAVIESVDPLTVILNQNSSSGGTAATIVIGNGKISVGGTAITIP